MILLRPIGACKVTNVQPWQRSADGMGSAATRIDKVDV